MTFAQLQSRSEGARPVRAIDARAERHPLRRAREAAKQQHRDVLGDAAGDVGVQGGEAKHHEDALHPGQPHQRRELGAQVGEHAQPCHALAVQQGKLGDRLPGGAEPDSRHHQHSQGEARQGRRGDRRCAARGAGGLEQRGLPQRGRTRRSVNPPARRVPTERPG